MQNKTVVFLSDLMPSKTLTAGAVLKSIANSIPLNWKILSLVIGDSDVHRNILNPIENSNLLFVSKPQVNWKEVNAPLPKALGEFFANKVETKQLAKKLQKVITLAKPDVVFIAPQCQIVTSLAGQLNFGSAKIINVMWDHPSWWADAHALGDKSRAEFLADWFSVFDNADARLLPSHNAKELFMNGSVQDEVLYPTFTRASSSKIKLKPTTFPTKTFKIVFAGQEYARSEIESFLQLLQLIDWTHEGRRIEFHHFGNSEIKFTNRNYIQHGMVGPEALIDAMSNMDFAYLPYPKTTELQNVARTSFPSKLGTYVASGLPVIYDGPEDTSAEEFILENAIGVSLVKTGFSESLRKLSAIKSPDVSRAYELHFSHLAFEKVVSRVLEVDVSETSRRALMQPNKVEISHVPHSQPRNRIVALTVLNQTTSEVELNLGGISVWHRKSISRLIHRLSNPKKIADHIRQAFTATAFSVSRKIFYATYGFIYRKFSQFASIIQPRVSRDQLIVKIWES